MDKINFSPYLPTAYLQLSTIIWCNKKLLRVSTFILEKESTITLNLKQN